MQEKNEKKHLVMRNVADVSATLKSFNPGEVEFIPISESHTTTQTYRARYHVLVKQGHINNTILFREGPKDGVPGTYIVCL